MQNQINTTPIRQFVQQIKSAEQSQSKEIKIPIQQARVLSLTLLEIMDKLVQDYESMYNTLKKSAETEVISVVLDGGELNDTE